MKRNLFLEISNELNENPPEEVLESDGE